MKLVFDEAESDVLAHWLAQREDMPKISSQIAKIELLRMCRGRDEGVVDGVRQVLAGLDLVPVGAELVERASLVGPAALRTLDAVHLASALSVSEDLLVLVVYDARLRSAAMDAGLQGVGPA